MDGERWGKQLVDVPGLEVFEWGNPSAAQRGKQSLNVYNYNIYYKCHKCET